jgi:hypothetical protein
MSDLLAHLSLADFLLSQVKVKVQEGAEVSSLVAEPLPPGTKF